jgi:phage-related protein
MKSQEGIGRVFYGVLAERSIVMLHAILKKTVKTPARDVQVARARLKELNENVDT